MRSLTADSRAVFLYLSGLDCARGLTVWILYRHKQYEDIVNLECHPNDYKDAYAFRDAFLSTKLLSKANFFKIKNIDRKAVALGKFVESEESCRRTNRDLSSDSPRYSEAGYGSVVNLARRKILEVLGDYSADEVFDSGNWGPGVTTLTSRDTSSINKFRSENGITKRAYDLLGELHNVAYPHWFVAFRQQWGSKITTVPKNAKTDRTIAIEPGINLWYQKAIGTMIRRRLKRVGINLNSQTRNQQLAYSSSKSDALATIDFSSASDTISSKVVELLLPERWYLLLNSVRCELGSYSKGGCPSEENSTWFKYEKFSSMGNGFTFELESLIFYALAYALSVHRGVDTDDISVYGDDVILSSSVADDYSVLMAHLGFTVNRSKSFWNSPFRESCGEYYYNGVDCKPFFFKESIINDEDQCYKTANSIRRISHRSVSRNDIRYCDIRLFRCWQFVASVAGNDPCLIPEGYGDGGLVVNFDEACPVVVANKPHRHSIRLTRPSRAKHGIEGYWVKVRAWRPKGFHADDNGLLLSRLKDRSADMSYGNTYAIRDQVRVSRIKILVPQWQDLGPWI